MRAAAAQAEEPPPAGLVGLEDRRVDRPEIGHGEAHGLGDVDPTAETRALEQQARAAGGAHEDVQPAAEKRAASHGAALDQLVEPRFGCGIVQSRSAILLDETERAAGPGGEEAVAAAPQSVERADGVARRHRAQRCSGRLGQKVAKAVADRVEQPVGAQAPRPAGIAVGDPDLLHPVAVEIGGGERVRGAERIGELGQGESLELSAARPEDPVRAVRYAHDQGESLGSERGQRECARRRDLGAFDRLLEVDQQRASALNRARHARRSHPCGSDRRAS